MLNYDTWRGMREGGINNQGEKLNAFNYENMYPNFYLPFNYLIVNYIALPQKLFIYISRCIKSCI